MECIGRRLCAIPRLRNEHASRHSRNHGKLRAYSIFVESVIRIIVAIDMLSCRLQLFIRNHRLVQALIAMNVTCQLTGN